jgi:hypothetical protein
VTRQAIRSPETASSRYYAVLVREEGEEYFLLPLAKSPPEAREAAVQLLSGYGPREARLEVYHQTDPRLVAQLIWCRLS